MNSSNDYETINRIEINCEDFPEEVVKYFRIWNEGFVNSQKANLCFSVKSDPEQVKGTLSIMMEELCVETLTINGSVAENLMNIFESNYIRTNLDSRKQISVEMVLHELNLTHGFLEKEKCLDYVNEAVIKEAEKGIDIVMQRNLSLDESDKFMYGWRFNMMIAGKDAIIKYKTKEIATFFNKYVTLISTDYMRAILAEDHLRLMSDKDKATIAARFLSPEYK